MKVDDGLYVYMYTHIYIYTEAHIRIDTEWLQFVQVIYIYICTDRTCVVYMNTYTVSFCVQSETCQATRCHRLDGNVMQSELDMFL